jgi:chaperonin GroES
VAEAYADDMTALEGPDELPPEQGGLEDVRPEAEKPFWTLENLERVENLAVHLDEDELATVARRVLDGLEVDTKSMEDWVNLNKRAMEVIKPDFDPKTAPFDSSANAKLPMITDAALKFAAEAYPELVKSGKVVKSAIDGPDLPEKAAKAERAARYQNWQITSQIPNWEEEQDRLLFQIALIGTVHKKVFWMSGEKRPETVLRVDGIVINNNARSPDEAPRVSDCFTLYGHEAESRFRRGEWRRVSLVASDTEVEAIDEDKAHDWIEQLCRIDLDKDGYDEPYIVTVHKTTEQVVAVRANWIMKDVERNAEGGLVAIRPYCHYIRYGFLPPLDNGYWMMGFGVLLGGLNDNVNALVNELLDSGAMANLSGGWMSSAIRMPKGEQTWAKGEWKSVQVLGGVLRDSIVPLPVQAPSQTLFALLEYLIGFGQRLSAVTSIMGGEQPRANMPAASVLALIEQGKKTFQAIWKRVYRSMDLEMKKIAGLNYRYGDVEAYKAFHDRDDVDVIADFEMGGMDFRLVATPEFSSKVERVALAEALLEGMQKGLPGVEPKEISRMFVSSLITDEQDLARLMPPEPSKTTQQILEEAEMAKQEAIASAEVQKAQAEAQEAGIRLQIAQLQAQVAGVKVQTDQVKAIAGAERAKSGAETAAVKLQEAQLTIGRTIDEHGMAQEAHVAEMERMRAERADRSGDR